MVGPNVPLIIMTRSMIELSNFSIQDRPAVSVQIYQFLKQAIISCQLEPGRAISEKEIAQALNVSRQPVREAFIQLTRCALVRVYPQRGTFVTPISIKQVLDGQLIRSSIECAVIGRLNGAINPEQLKNLKQLIAWQQQAVTENDYHQFLQADDAFHKQLALAADCELAWGTIENIKAVMDRIRFLDISCDQDMNKLIQEHQQVVDALVNEQLEEATHVLYRHLNDFPRAIEDIQKQHPQWFA